MRSPKSSSPRTTVVGSYPIPAWLAVAPTEQAVADATAVVLKTQELAGIDVVADGELYRFDVNHPDTNGMIDYFVRPLSGVRAAVGREDGAAFGREQAMAFRAKPAGVVVSALGQGTLDLVLACQRARRLTRAPFKFTVTGPHMLSRTLLDRHYGRPEELCFALAGVLAKQAGELEAEVVQVDEANITGHPEDAPWAAEALNLVLDAVRGERGVHLCFGNYGGQTIQRGTWGRLVRFINALHADHVLLEMTRRRSAELDALRALDPRLGVGLGVVDIKTNVVESAEDIARRIERAAAVLGAERLRFVNPDCGFWMLPRSVADRKMRALVEGRDLYLGSRRPG